MEQHENLSLKTLDELDFEERFRDIPLFTYLSLAFVLGILGNSVVLLIFNRSYARSTFRLFVIYLSSVDLFSCTFGIPIEIVSVIYGLKNVNTLLCKALAFFTTLPTITSVLLLLAISVDRHRKICKPFSWQITNKAARNIFICSVFVSFACSALRFVTFGSRPTTFEMYNITIFTCEVTEDMEMSVIAIVTPNLIGGIFFIVICVIITMYCCIAVRIRKQMNTKRKIIGKVLNKTKGNKTLSISDIRTVMNKEHISKIKAASDETKTVQQSSKLDVPHTIEISQDQKQLPGNPSNSKQTNRSAFVMFMVTIAFFLSFAPAFPLILTKSSIESNLERTLYKFFIRSYLLNCVINPIIYGFFDPQFRILCKMFFSCKQV